MKYLHSGYILLCEKADEADDGRVNAHGLLDIISVDSFPQNLKCHLVVGFGTPYERRTYHALVRVEDPDRNIVFQEELNASESAKGSRGHAIFPCEMNIDREGCYTVIASLHNWKNENVWDCERKIWSIQSGENEQGKGF